MKKFEVLTHDFHHVGYVMAEDAMTALSAAKKRYPFVFAPMVQEVGDGLS